MDTLINRRHRQEDVTKILSRRTRVVLTVVPASDAVGVGTDWERPHRFGTVDPKALLAGTVGRVVPGAVNAAEVHWAADGKHGKHRPFPMDMRQSQLRSRGVLRNDLRASTEVLDFANRVGGAFDRCVVAVNNQLSASMSDETGSSCNGS